MFQLMLEQMTLGSTAKKDKRAKPDGFNQLERTILDKLRGRNMTPQEMADEWGFHADSVTRAIRILSKKSLLKCVRPVNKGNLKRPALWTTKNAS